MADAGSVTLETFTPLLGETFSLGAAEVTLAEAVPLADVPPPSGRRPFSLLFRGTPPPVVAQGMHRVAHAAIGDIELVLVPLQPDADGARYEAVFS
jgi:hypothetical protein